MSSLHAELSRFSGDFLRSSLLKKQREEETRKIDTCSENLNVYHQLQLLCVSGLSNFHVRATKVWVCRSQKCQNVSRHSLFRLCKLNAYVIYVHSLKMEMRSEWYLSGAAFIFMASLREWNDVDVEPFTIGDASVKFEHEWFNLRLTKIVESANGQNDRWTFMEIESKPETISIFSAPGDLINLSLMAALPADVTLKF